MPMSPQNQRFFHRTLYGPWNETVTLLKRGDDGQAGQVVPYVLFDVRWSRIYKTGQPIAGQMTSDHKRTVHVPRVELERVGVAYINALDRFVDKEGRYWQPESTSLITVKLGLVHIDIDCWLTDPPVNTAAMG